MKTKNTKCDRLDHKKIIEIYKKNGSLVETSRLIGTTEALVKKVLVSNGIYVTKKNPLNNIDHEALIKRYEEIHLTEPVAKEFNISKSSVLKILHQNNIRVSKIKYTDQEIIDYYNKVKTITKTAT
jgi:DNA invertase Pin-like site-specific DNA recombinase